MNHLRSLQLDQPRRRSRNIKSTHSRDQDQADQDGGDDGDAPFKDGTVLLPREDGRPHEVPDGYAVVQGENGAIILRKKRTRNLQKLGIGGFQVRRPWARVKDKEEDAPDTAEILLKDPITGVVTTGTSSAAGVAQQQPPGDQLDTMNKPKRKPQRRKPKNKLAETYPSYLQVRLTFRILLYDELEELNQHLTFQSV